jgi:eukaryotic-like serine/threonine-protein kinase
MQRASTLRRLGGYELERCLSAGATNHVYRARSPNAPAPVAIKLLAPALTVHPELVARFHEEAALSLQLRHPNLVHGITSGTSSGVPFLVMDLIEGPTVAEVLERLHQRGSRMDIGAALAITRDACRALGYAHHFIDGTGAHRQIIHGDVSPANLILCKSGVVKLVDFGVARVVGAFDFDVTASGSGRHAYMAPEQVRGEPIDRRVDVFAMGVVLHEMLTGRPLYAAGSPLETLRRAAAAEVDFPSRDRPELPRMVDTITRRALAKDRAQRYPSGAAMARALDAMAGMLHSRRRLAELVRELRPDWDLTMPRPGDRDTVPIEGMPVTTPEDWDRWDTARVEVG